MAVANTRNLCGWRCKEFHYITSLLQEVIPEDSVAAKHYTVWVLFCKTTALCGVLVAQVVV
jgi:hypothetical protein